jgi:hypothetical protein
MPFHSACATATPAITHTFWHTDAMKNEESGVGTPSCGGCCALRPPLPPDRSAVRQAVLVGAVPLKSGKWQLQVRQWHPGRLLNCLAVAPQGGLLHTTSVVGRGLAAPAPANMSLSRWSWTGQLAAFLHWQAPGACCAWSRCGCLCWSATYR